MQEGYSNYILYRDGTLSVIAPLRKVRPLYLVPLFQATSKSDDSASRGSDDGGSRGVIEIQFPQNRIDLDSVQLLAVAEHGFQRILPRKQTHALDEGIPKVRFYLQDARILDFKDDLAVQYLDLAPELSWSVCYEGEISEGNDPNQALLRYLICTLTVDNNSKQVIGPGTFEIMLKNSDTNEVEQMARLQQEQRRERGRMVQRTMEAKSEAIAPMMAMAAQSQPKERKRRRAAPEATGSEAAEGSVITLPGPQTFDKLSTTQIVLSEMNKIPIHKIHCWQLQHNERQNGPSSIVYQFKPTISEMEELPGGLLTLFTDSRQRLNKFSVPKMRDQELVRLRGNVDTKVKVHSHNVSKVLQVDKKGNQVTMYSGGCEMMSGYHAPLEKFEVYLPIDRPEVKILQLEGPVAHWVHEIHKSRIKFVLDSFTGKVTFSFVVKGLETIEVDNRTIRVEGL